MGWAVAVVGVAGGTLILAQTVAPDTITGWLTGSAVTVLAFNTVAYLRGWFVAGRTHDRVIAERGEAIADGKELRAEIRELNKLFKDQVIPALVRTTDTLARATDVLARVTEQQNQQGQQGDRR